MTDLCKAAQQALDTMDFMLRCGEWYCAQERADALRAALAQPEQLVVGGDDLPTLTKWTPMAEYAAQPEQTAMPQDIAKVLFDNVESLYVEDAQPEPDYAVCVMCGGMSVDPIVKQPEQEPVAWMTPKQDLHLANEEGFRHSNWTPLYAHSPQRNPLTDEEIVKIRMDCWRVTPLDIYFARAIEKAHGIGVEE